MALAHAKDKLKSEVASSRPRGEKGEFLSIPKIKSSDSPLTQFLKSHTGNYKDQEDLLDIRIGNPLRRVIELLEEIKSQKAFSFTLKGSLGIAGVVLLFSFFGLLGGSEVLCNKGVQTHIGTIKVLNYREIYQKDVPFLSFLFDLAAPSQKEIKNRVVLIKENNETIYIPFSENLDLTGFNNVSVLATGSYNVCTNTLLISDLQGVEVFTR